MGKRQGTPWLGHQSITKPQKNKLDKQPYTHFGKWKKGSRGTQRETTTATAGERANSTQRARVQTRNPLL